MAAARKVVAGPPGEVWSNLTGKVWYQRLCDFRHSCGLCIRLHRLVAARWDLPTHLGCTCRVVVVLPGDDALPFVDFAESLRDLPEPARIRAVGASNWRLVKAGLVTWEDVVTPARVRSFAEVVRAKKLGKRALARAGIPPHLIPGAGPKPKVKPTPKPKPEPRPAPKPAAPALPAYGPSRATVVIPAHAEQSEAKVLKGASKVFGRPVTLRDIANAVGAPDDATVEVSIDYAGAIDVRLKGPGYKAHREIKQNVYREKLIVENVSFDVEPGRQGKGIGAAIFGRQVEQAAKLGIVEIRATAGGPGGGLNGYYVWPRFGYDSPIPRDLKAKLPGSLAGSERLSDLMTTEGGRDWWKANGQTVMVTFDLAEGSLSRRAWDGYRAEKAKGE